MGKVIFLSRMWPQTSIFRKPTNSGRVLNYDSERVASARTAVARALMKRVETHFARDDVKGRNKKDLTFQKF